MWQRLLLFFLMSVVWVSSAFAEKVCPIDGEVFPDSAVYCPKHGVKLIERSASEIYVYTVDGKTENLEFAGFNKACQGFTDKGIKYREGNITTTIPWSEVRYVLPYYGKAFLKNGSQIVSETLKPGNCRSSYIHERKSQIVTVAGYKRKASVDIKIMLSQISVMAFNARDLEMGRKALKQRDAFDKEGRATRLGNLSQRFAFVRGGCYEMGDTFGEGEPNELPVHKVCVSDFYMEKYEVTQGLWKEVMGYNPSRYKEGDDYPVESVSWLDAKKFIEKLNKETGGHYRLPTEAEWEYACRDGGRNIRFPWGQQRPVCRKGAKNGAKFNDYGECDATGTEPVGSYAPNGLGLYDMSGNVWEWVEDVYDKDAYKKLPVYNPVFKGDSILRVERGGSWVYDWKNQRCAQRDYYSYKDGSSVLGFRLVRDK